MDETGSRLLREGKLPQHPSFFESVTAVAFLYFAEQAVDIAVLEVGMGGRLDATNIVEPLLSIITDISLDHTEWLGATIDAIAREKAGILRPNGILVTLPQHPAANQALGEVAVDLNVRGVSAVEFMPPRRSAEKEATEFYSEPYSVTVAGTSVELRPALAGTHQHRNAALAVAAANELCNSNSYNITPQQIAEGISTARWPGRLEVFPAPILVPLFCSMLPTILPERGRCVPRSAPGRDWQRKFRPSEHYCSDVCARRRWRRWRRFFFQSSIVSF